MEKDPSKLKVALVHDWLTGYRGGEKVLESLCRIFPKAPLFTLVHQEGSTSAEIEKHPIHTSFLQHMPLGVRKYRHYLPLFPAAAESFQVKGFDLIVSTSSAMAKSIPTYGAKHWCYIHTPMRYIWDRFDDYFGAERVGKIPSHSVFKPIAKLLQKYDVQTSQRVDHFVANSTFVAGRVRDCYNRHAEVIPPPVEVDTFATIERNPKGYYLFLSTLVPYKKADHAIRACQMLGRKLVVIGNGQELSTLKRRADPLFIQFISDPSPEQIRKAYAEAEALLYPGIEDFGIVPVEAIASGCPVIAFGKGGILDSQTHETAILYSEQSPDALARAISEFECRKKLRDFDPEVLRKRAQVFSRSVFESRIQKSLDDFIHSAF